MEVSNRIPIAVITATTNLLQPYCPDLNPRNLIRALKSFDTNPQKPQDSVSQKSDAIERPLTRFEVADLLQVSLPTVNRLMSSGRIRKIKFSQHGTVRIDPVSVREFLAYGSGQETPTY